MKIHWYPGHIAKAERALKEQLKRVDVVLEVRDARIPLATHHPQMLNWVGSKARILVINRMDMISPALREEWESWFEARGESVYFTNAEHGHGINALADAVQSAGVQLNQRRFDRGMLPRPVRAVVIGFPNVGKSALINRLLGRKVVDSARRAGVTRSLRWVRISDQIELLDTPGVIPTRINNQDNALKLAICEDIGEAAYDNQVVAAAMVDLLLGLEATDDTLISVSGFKSRYKLDALSTNGENYLHEVAKERHQGDVERMARQMLNDFRTGVLGQLPLELPPI
ncbi:MAG: ribosome biogenesis GTPase YlqF [Oscillatoriales cyanobacterium]|uniref:Ribosome biogenesis GTPase A n=1 Tax=Microcoleus anatoxicus PTRS2 TaxID=2705321 RepID=A0ABU8YSU0_9CYAN|nr:MAG: ribosome biogenesis GTPase YlqF [Oscillatoriales cyanobacterium]TAD94164.1 MAG: ribosome biogenesis GTPase YlqF [Oscillatoriales cyanobacterium]TAE06944.1 MAG: ribosome biogenesis GTPase YlqF [Oscillatoriales cyanobacterium]TAF06484.1 MAG: ribosome biogenesis GTPase YlqF [Oscillatoriales cyanobacterium]TAF45511.1 MAG: ribosome biogenesis GTPase YlqF [Oscillatoriales cyanobacterium]